jgi:hypothetical protein
MSNLKDNMSRRIYIRLKEKDFEAIQRRFSKTTCRKLSEYARRVLLDKVITVNHRNQSLDDFMTEMIRLRNELKSIGNNLNQSVKKLHTLEQISEFKTWIIINETHQKILEKKVDEIKEKINQISDAWLH